MHASILSVINLTLSSLIPLGAVAPALGLSDRRSIFTDHFIILVFIINEHAVPDKKVDTLVVFECSKNSDGFRIFIL